jgi:dTDP-4-dehydrorhamnose reductase
VLPVSSEKFKSKAKRPNYSLLNTEKIEQAFQLIIPDWKKSLNECVKKLKI